MRLSDLTDNTTSPGRQKEAGETCAASIGARVIGYATDLDVSASKKTPFQRPELGAWLGRPDEYDVIVFWRLDRAVRSMADMSNLAAWAREHSKRLVFAEGPGGGRLELDLTSGSIMAELIMLLLAFAAQMESQATAERVTGSRAALRTMGRWHGGQPPYGYRAAPNPEGAGKVLEPDPEAVKVLETITGRLLEGATPHAVGRELNEAGIPTPKAHYDLSRGRMPKVNARWAGADVKRVITSPAVLGHQLFKGATVRDDAGRPVLAAVPVVEREEYDRVKAALALLARPERRQRGDTRALLLGVAHCAGCERRMYRVTCAGGRADVYGCRTRSTGHHCPAPSSMRAQWLEEYAEGKFLTVMGRRPVTRVVEHDGYDPAPELAEVTAELSALIPRQREAKSAATRAVWAGEIAKLEARAAELEATPRTEPRREVITTGQTGAELWQRTDLEGRRRILLDAGAVITVSPSKGGRVTTLDTTRLTFALGETDPAGDALRAIVMDEAA